MLVVEIIEFFSDLSNEKQIKWIQQTSPIIQTSNEFRGGGRGAFNSDTREHSILTLQQIIAAFTRNDYVRPQYVHVEISKTNIFIAHMRLDLNGSVFFLVWQTDTALWKR